MKFVFKNVSVSICFYRDCSRSLAGAHSHVQLGDNLAKVEDDLRCFFKNRNGIFWTLCIGGIPFFLFCKGSKSFKTKSPLLLLSSGSVISGFWSSTLLAGLWRLARTPVVYSSWFSFQLLKTCYPRSPYLQRVRTSVLVAVSCIKENKFVQLICQKHLFSDVHTSFNHLIASRPPGLEEGGGVIQPLSRRLSCSPSIFLCLPTG